MNIKKTHSRNNGRIIRLQVARPTESGFDPLNGQKLFLSPQRWTYPPSPISNKHGRLSPKEQNGQGVKLTPYFHLVLTLIMHLDITQFLHVFTKQRHFALLHIYTREFAYPFEDQWWLREPHAATCKPCTLPLSVIHLLQCSQVIHTHIYTYIMGTGCILHETSLSYSSFAECPSWRPWHGSGG